MSVQVRVHLRDKVFASEISALVSMAGTAEVECSTSDEIAPFIRDLNEEMLLVVDHNEVDVRSLLDTLSYNRKCPRVIVLNNQDPEKVRNHLSNSMGYSRATVVPRTSATDIAGHITSLAERTRQTYGSNTLVAGQTRQRATPERQLIFDPVFIEELLEQAPVGVLITTQDNKLQYVNTYGADLLGCNELEAIGQPLTQLAPSLSEKLIATAKLHTAGPGAGPVEFELSHFHPRRILSLRIAPLADPSQVSKRNLIILQDATLRANALLQSNQASEAKSQFLANASHELRTPLNAILGYAELLIMTGGSDGASSAMQYAENIHAGGKHLLSIANDLIDLAKLESRGLDLFLQHINAFELLEDCVKLTEPIAIRNGVTVSLQPASEQGPFVFADKLRLKQCVLNLLSNAIKYSVDAGTVIIQLTRLSDDFVQICIEDDGIGIPIETQENLFDLFVTSNQAAPKANERGGLGLHLTKQLVESMSGFISFESREGRGSTFCLKLPSAKETGRS